MEHFTKAVQSDPDNGEFKINLRRAQEEAARAHLEKAREFERNDQLDQALMEYRKALELMGTDRVSRGQGGGSSSARFASAIEATQAQAQDRPVAQRRAGVQRAAAPATRARASRSG